MIKISIKDFIFEVKDEILSYEELGEEKAIEWEINFKKWIEKNYKNKVISFCKLEDESVIFDFADAFYYANQSNELDNYWKNFKIKLF